MRGGSPLQLAACVNAASQAGGRGGAKGLHLHLVLTFTCRSYGFPVPVRKVLK